MSETKFFADKKPRKEMERMYAQGSDELGDIPEPMKRVYMRAKEMGSLATYGDVSFSSEEIALIAALLVELPSLGSAPDGDELDARVADLAIQVRTLKAQVTKLSKKTPPTEQE